MNYAHFIEKALHHHEYFLLRYLTMRGETATVVKIQFQGTKSQNVLFKWYSHIAWFMDFSFSIQNSADKSVHLKFENIFVYILLNKFTQPFVTALQKSVPADTGWRV